MEERFALSLSQEERRYLLDAARSRIEGLLHGRKAEALELPSLSPSLQEGALREKLGAFVTLKRNEHLRGCIGRIVSDAPLYRTVGDMAEAAAFHDSRFPPLLLSEFTDIEVEVSVMGPIRPCPDSGLVEVGRHGLIVRRKGRQGLLLPQVPVEWEWDRETFLSQTCRKAGLPPDAWRDPDTELSWFEALVVCNGV